MRIVKTALCSLLFIAVAAGLAAPRLAAQDTAQIVGTLSDATGAALPGAQVTATNTATGAARTVESGADGRFLLTALPLGTYSLRYQKQGFATTTVSGVVLQIGAVVERHDKLELAAQQATVEVTGTAPPIDTTKSNVAGVITATQIA